MTAAKSTITAAKSMVVIASPTTPPTPNGFSTGPNALPAKKTPRGSIAAPAAKTTHAKNLQRRDGSRPVGNSSKTKGMRVMSIPHPSPSTVLTARGAGSEPGSTTKA